MLITANGLVTRVYRTGNDHILHLITEEHGRLSVMVKGSKHAAATQLFTYGNYELYRSQGSELYWLRGAAVTRHFFEVTADLATMALSAYLCDVGSALCGEETPIPETETLLRMLLNTLHALATQMKPREQIKAVFELRLAALMGYCPDLTACSRCGEGYPEQLYVDIMNGCLICADCQTALNRLHGPIQTEREQELGERRIICPISASVLAAMRYALSAPDRKIFSFTLTSDDELRSFAHVAETYLLNQLEQDFDTLKFYRSVVD